MKNSQNTPIFFAENSHGGTEVAMQSPVAEALKMLMAKERFRPIDLIRRTNFGSSTVFRHLNGDIVPSIDKREKYAQVLGVSPLEFEKLWKELEEMPEMEDASGIDLKVAAKHREQNKRPAK